MQIKFKKQIDIELDRSDLLEAVRGLLKQHGQVITDEELEEIKFINSPQTGIRATLKVTEESVDTAGIINGTPTDVIGNADIKVSVIDGGKITTQGSQVTAIPAVVTHEPEPVPVQPVEYDDEEPGVIAASTVEDVMPGIDEIKTMVTTGQEPTASDKSAVPSAESLRTSLF